MELLVLPIVEYLQRALPHIPLIDEDYGQLENLEVEDTDMYPILFPCVLIEPSETDWSYVQGDSQKGKCRVRVRLCIDCYDDTHAQSGTTYKIEQRERLRREVHHLLQGFRPQADGAMMREQSRYYTWKHGIKVYEEVYTVTVTDCRTERVNTAHPKISLVSGIIGSRIGEREG